MKLSIIEYLAAIVIVLVIVKIIVVLLKPKAWLAITKKIYKNPQFTSIVSLLLSGVVLYFLLQSGISILQILAVTLFVSLLMMSGIAPYTQPFINWAEKQDLRQLLKNAWLYSLVWIVLLFWGVVELLR